MKYTSVIAALFAAANVNEVAGGGPTGCKKGIQGKFYTDSSCEKAAHTTFNFMEKDVETTGKCNKHEATKEDADALKTANADLKKAKKATADKLNLLNGVDKIDVDDKVAVDGRPVMHKSVPVFLGDDYAPLKKLHDADKKSTLAWHKYQNSITDADKLNKINDYATAYFQWYYAEINLDKSVEANKNKIAALKATLDSKPLPKDADVVIIKTHVRNYEQYEKAIKDKYSNLKPAIKCVQASKCTQQDVTYIIRQYLQADFDYDLAKAEQAKLQTVATQAMDTILEHTFATLTTCDYTEGIVHKEYWGRNNCEEGKPSVTFKAKWGACVKAPDGTFVKITGASALKAAAIALAAFAGSQF